MGKEIKKKKIDPNYMSMERAMEKLQITQREFLRLCILKGVFPKESRKKKEGQDKTYYSSKEIRMLFNDEVLNKFREISAFMKRIKKAKNQQNETKFKLLQTKIPKYSLHQTIRDRYPSFTDALNDLDDCLSLISLFASIPASTDFKIPKERIQLCNQLLTDFQTYCAVTQSLDKVFLSIKGIYYQVVIKSVKITWLIPYKFTQNLPKSVDYQIMLTFLEFYENVLKFVIYKLFADIGIVYPLPESKNFQESILNARSKISQAKSSGQQNEEIQKDLQELQKYEEVNKILQKEETEQSYKKLFNNYFFFINREAPRFLLEFSILCFGGSIGWEENDSPFQKNDNKVTHEIIDRPLQEDSLRKDREYVQPQWIADCINAKTILSVLEYKPNRIPPPHLSPFDESFQQHFNQIQLEKNVEIGLKKMQEKNKELEKETQQLKKEKKLKELGMIQMSKKAKKKYEMLKKAEEQKNLVNKKAKKRKDHMMEIEK